MLKIRQFLRFLSHFRNGYDAIDKVKIFLYTILYITCYPINRMAFLLLKKIIIQPEILFDNFKIKNSDGLFFCRNNIDFDVVSEMFEYGMRKYFKKFKRGIFVDIGANIGKYTIMLGNQTGINGKIISIEPHPENFEVLKKNIGLNKCENVITINLACWNKKARLKLSSHNNQPLLASAINPSKKYIEVNADSLDNILKKLKIKNVAFIKLDVEGVESKVLEGMKNVLKFSKPKIIFESWDGGYINECKKILKDYDYKIKQLDEMYWLGFHNVGQQNI